MLAKSTPEVLGKEDEWAQQRPMMSPSERCPLLGARDRAWGRNNQDLASSLIFYLVMCVSESCLKS